MAVYINGVVQFIREGELRLNLPDKLLFCVRIETPLCDDGDGAEHGLVQRDLSCRYSAYRPGRAATPCFPSLTHGRRLGSSVASQTSVTRLTPTAIYAIWRRSRPSVPAVSPA
jgi:hypothetical protein